MRKTPEQAITDLMAQVRREHSNEFAGDRYLHTREILNLLGMEPGIDYDEPEAPVAEVPVINSGLGMSRFELL